MKKKLWSVLAAVLVMCALLAGCGPAQDSPSSPVQSGGKEVSSIAVSKEPDKTEYAVGETFSAQGGEITITYADGSTETRDMTDSEVSLSEVSIAVNDANAASETKTVTVRFGGKSTRFDVTVSQVLCTVTYDLGYDGQTTTAGVRKDEKVERPADPVREDRVFDNWYADASLTALFDFDAPITGDVTVYAKWLEDSAYYDVLFDSNYAGAVEAAPQKVQEGGQAVRPSVDPERKGYAFDGWYADPEGAAEFDFSTVITQEITIYAKWTKTVSGRNWYVFEAEDTNLNGKSGPGLSGTAGGPGMIQLDEKLGASNNRFVGYQYEVGCGLEFQFNSDTAVSDATIVISLSAELRDFDIDPQSYKMSLNGVDLDYGTISFTGVPTGSSDDVGSVNALPFADYVVVENAQLKEGMNVFSVVTMNDEAMGGTTMLAKAPLVDCIKIETEAVLDWAAQLGLPKKNY